jgi:hypothetical protein
MWIDEIQRNTHTKIQAQTYFYIKDIKLTKSSTKGQKYNTIYYFVLFLHCTICYTLYGWGMVRAVDGECCCRGQALVFFGGSSSAIAWQRRRGGDSVAATSSSAAWRR